MFNKVRYMFCFYKIDPRTETSSSKQQQLKQSIFQTDPVKSTAQNLFYPLTNYVFSDRISDVKCL